MSDLTVLNIIYDDSIANTIRNAEKDEPELFAERGRDAKPVSMPIAKRNFSLGKLVSYNVRKSDGNLMNLSLKFLSNNARLFNLDSQTNTISFKKPTGVLKMDDGFFLLFDSKPRVPTRQSPILRMDQKTYATYFDDGIDGPRPAVLEVKPQTLAQTIHRIPTRRLNGLPSAPTMQGLPSTRPLGKLLR